MRQPYYYFLNRNKNGDGFLELLNGEIFVDKTGLIEIINSKISTKEKWICVSRPRRWIAAFSAHMIKDLNHAFPDILGDAEDLALCLDMICQVTGEKFIFLADEWDCIFRIRRASCIIQI